MPTGKTCRAKQLHEVGDCDVIPVAFLFGNDYVLSLSVGVFSSFFRAE